ncbi:MAG: AAA family ATPase [Candidatus Woesearchaeota archaeon]
MTDIIAVTGGKGGTGKSTVATALAYELSRKSSVLLVDADVDCPNDHLLLNIQRKELEIVYQRIPFIDQRKCTKCGKCGKVCKTKALISIKDRTPIFIQEQCNGCGSCEIVCPEQAISWQKKEIGKLYKGSKDSLDLLSGELKVNQPTSEFIVDHLNEEIRKKENNYGYIIIDTAAGTHCPVIASFESAGKVIAVTEPTPLGVHDLEIILRLLKKINKHGTVIVNRSDVGDIQRVNDMTTKYDTRIIFKIPFSEEIVDSYSKGNPIMIKNILEVLE